ncbi:MAG: sugar phosphate isomerase/epimerase [Anaerolineales bacterium]|nr:sugar phosphate isomerase/epimerase [Anaerolineales bacterium]
MKLSIVLSTQPAQFQAATFQGDFESNVQKIAAMGYDGVELTVRDPALLDANKVAAFCSSNGLEIPAVGTGQAWGEEGLSYTDPDASIRSAAIERTLSHIPFAARTGATGSEHSRTVIIIGLLRGLVRPEVSQKQAMDWVVDALQECCAAAAQHGVRIALEPINRYETSLVNNVEQGMNLLERIGHDNMGLLLDTFHMNIEDASIENSIRTCGDRIFHFHVADSNRWYPGAGHLDFESILGTLLNTGYQGYVSGEFLPKPDAETSARMSITCLRQFESKG